MQLSMQLAKLFLTVSVLSLSGCAGMQIADIGPGVTLPASGDCFQITVLTRKETRTPKAECDKMKRKAIFITLEDWRIQRYSIQKQCQLSQCKQLVGAFDDLFLTIDKGLQQMPLPVNK